MSSHARWEELAAGHALNSLEPEDEHEFLRHLRGCDLCARTLDEMHKIGSELSYAVDGEEPPPSLLASIMDAVQREDRPVLTPGAGVGRPAATDDLAERRRRTATRRRFFGSSGRATWLTSAAALVLIFVLGLWNVTLRSDIRNKEQQLALRAQLEELVTSPGTKVIALGQPGAAAFGSAVVHDRRVMLVVDGLDETEGRRAYVLWARGKDSTTMVAVQKFGISNPGRPNVIPEMQIPSTVGSVVEVAVTQELIGPGDDLPQTPSGSPFLRGQLA